MGITLKTIRAGAVVAMIASVCGLVPLQVAHAKPLADGSVTIDGLVTDKDKAVAGLVVVAWCGDLSHFGGSNTTDASGHYLIHTNTIDCPLGAYLTVTTDRDSDGASDGAAHTPVHTSTTVSIKLGSYDTIAVPEFGWISAAASLAIGASVVVVIRRRCVGPLYTTGG